MALEKIRGIKPAKNDLVAVVGAGRSGLGAARLLQKNGVKVRLLDKNEAALTKEQQAELKTLGVEIKLGPHEKKDFFGARFIIPSPGMPIASLSEFVEYPDAIIMSEMELAWRFLDNEPVLAVTGTSGKTTTASLAASMLKYQGYTVFLGGNIGTPLSEYVLSGRKADVIVLEASSFQLQGCTTFCPRVGILLNISANHLDYHKDMAEYEEAKFRLFRCQDENDLAIFTHGLEDLAASFHVKSRKLWIEDVGRFPDMVLRGAHNALNAEAAWQGARFFGVSQENAAKAVAAFQPLPHRLETVAQINGVTYINDSKCTTLAALKVALEAMDKPVRLLCGGIFKGGDPTELNTLISEKVLEIGLFGASREIFENAWQNLAPVSWAPTLKEATLKLAANARSGDVILLAPATSSYDLYANYCKRGEDFKHITAGLKEELG